MNEAQRKELQTEVAKLADKISGTLYNTIDATDNLGFYLAELDMDASTLHGMIHDLWKQTRGQ